MSENDTERRIRRSKELIKKSEEQQKREFSKRISVLENQTGMEKGTVIVNGVSSPAERDADGTIFSCPDVSARALASYPEHDKLRSVKDRSQIIGDFLSWLQEEQSVVLAKSHRHNANCVEEGDRVCGVENNQLVPEFRSIPQWLAQYFDIDEYKLEEEKRSMLDELRLMPLKGDLSCSCTCTTSK
jgi:hypothetical protein